MTHKSLSEIKDEVAISLPFGYKNWIGLMKDLNLSSGEGLQYSILNLADKVAELYALKLHDYCKELEKEIERLKGKTNYDEVEVLTKEIERLKKENDLWICDAHDADQRCKDLKEENEKLLKFKQYVHDRLDKMGIEKDPESEHKAVGCRIGGRLDIVERLIK